MVVRALTALKAVPQPPRCRAEFPVPLQGAGVNQAVVDSEPPSPAAVAHSESGEGRRGKAGCS